MSSRKLAAMFCGASNDSDFTTLAECKRRNGHDDDHHCDVLSQLAWNDEGPVLCPDGYDHGQPPNLAARRAARTWRPNHLVRIRRNEGRN